MAAFRKPSTVDSVRNTELWFEEPKKRRSGKVPFTVRPSQLLRTSAIAHPVLAKPQRYHEDRMHRSGCSSGFAEIDRLARPGGFVNRHHDLHVAQAFLARDASGCLLQDAARELVHLDRELIRGGGIDLPAVTADPAYTAEVEGRVEAEPTNYSQLTEITGTGCGVTTAAVTDDAAGKPGLPHDRLFDFGEPCRIALGGSSRDPGGLLAAEISRRLQAIDTNIHQWTAAGQILLQTPYPGRGVEPEVRINDFEGAELFLACNAHAFQMMRLKAAAVADAQHPVRRLHRIDHLLAALDGDLHRLLAENVFARLGGYQRVVQMNGVRRHDIHDIDVLVVGDPVHRLVVVDVLVGDVVLGLPLHGFRGRARDDPGQPAVFGLLHRRSNLVGTEAAQPAQRESQLLTGGGGQRPGHAGADEGSGSQGGGSSDELAAICGHRRCVLRDGRAGSVLRALTKYNGHGQPLPRLKLEKNAPQAP